MLGYFGMIPYNLTIPDFRRTVEPVVQLTQIRQEILVNQLVW